MISSRIPRFLFSSRSILQTYAPKIMAAEPKTSGSTIKLMIAHRIPMLKYNAEFFLWGAEYEGGLVDGRGHSEPEFSLDTKFISWFYDSAFLIPFLGSAP